MKDRIKKLRKELKLNQTDFGSRIGASQAMVTSYETGRVVPSDAMLKLISKEYGVSYSWLKTGEGSMMEPVPDNDNIEKISEQYNSSIKKHILDMIDILIEIDPDWRKTLDTAFDEIERRQKERDAE